MHTFVRGLRKLDACERRRAPGEPGPCLDTRVHKSAGLTPESVSASTAKLQVYLDEAHGDVCRGTCVGTRERRRPRHIGGDMREWAAACEQWARIDEV